LIAAGHYFNRPSLINQAKLDGAKPRGVGCYFFMIARAIAQLSGN
jgi:hypothetical protein